MVRDLGSPQNPEKIFFCIQHVGKCTEVERFLLFPAVNYKSALELGVFAWNY
jgi:hypothetical protein